MSQTSTNAHRHELGVFALILWALTTVLAVVMIPSVIETATDIYAAFAADYSEYGETYWQGVALRQLLVLPLALLAVAITIGGAEYHLRNFGTRKSWLIFAHTLALELGFLLMKALL